MPYPTPEQIAAIYEARNRAIAKLRVQSSIELADLADLDRCGRGIVASELWDLCAQPVRDALLTDMHHFVRSAATLAEA